jgi:hypothetical protein
VKKRLWHSDDGDDSSRKLEEETKENKKEVMGEKETEEEEVSSKKLMNQPNISKEKLMRKSTHGSDDGDTSSMASEPLSRDRVLSRADTMCCGIQGHIHVTNKNKRS